MKGETEADRLQRCVITKETVASLISVSQLDRSGHAVLFDNGMVTITDKDNKIVSEGTLSKTSYLYLVDINTLTAPAPSFPHKHHDAPKAYVEAQCVCRHGRQGGDRHGHRGRGGAREAEGDRHQCN